MKKFIALLLGFMMLFTSCALADGADLVVSDIQVSLDGQDTDLGNPLVRLGGATDGNGANGVRFVLTQEDETVVEVVLSATAEQLAVASNLLPKVYVLNLGGLTASQPTENEKLTNATKALLDASVAPMINFVGSVDLEDKGMDADGCQNYVITVSADTFNTLRKQMREALASQPEALKLLGLEEVAEKLASAPDADVSMKGTFKLGETLIQADLEVLSAGAPAGSLNIVMTSETYETNALSKGTITLNTYEGETATPIGSLDFSALTSVEGNSLSELTLSLNYTAENNTPKTLTLAISKPVDGKGMYIDLSDSPNTFSFDLTIGTELVPLGAALAMDGVDYAFIVMENSDSTMELMANVIDNGAEKLVASAKLNVEETDGAWLAMDTSNAADLMTLLTALE